MRIKATAAIVAASILCMGVSACPTGDRGNIYYMGQNVFASSIPWLASYPLEIGATAILNLDNRLEQSDPYWIQRINALGARADAAGSCLFLDFGAGAEDPPFPVVEVSNIGEMVDAICENEFKGYFLSPQNSQRALPFAVAAFQGLLSCPQPNVPNVQILSIDFEEQASGAPTLAGADEIARVTRDTCFPCGTETTLPCIIGQ